MDIKVGPGRCEAELPWGYLDEQGKVHYRATVREMTGKEEEIFFSEKISVKNRMARIASSCLEELGDLEGAMIAKAFQALTPADYVNLLLMIRMATLGEEYEFLVKCEECSKKFKATVDLSTLATFDGNTMGGRNIRQHEVELPGGRIVKMRVVTMKEADQVDFSDTKRGSVKDDKKMSRLLLSRMLEFDGRAPKMEDLLSLSMRDRNTLRHWIRKVETGIDDNIDVECPTCSAEFQTPLDIGQMSFFFPEEGGLEDQTNLL